MTVLKTLEMWISRSMEISIGETRTANLSNREICNFARHFIGELSLVKNCQGEKRKKNSGLRMKFKVSTSDIQAKL